MAQNWIVKYNLSEQEYQQVFDKLSTQYVPNDINVVKIKNDNKFACIWYLQNKDSAFIPWQSRHNLSQEDYCRLTDDFIRNGHIPYFVTPYMTSQNALKFAAVWSPGVDENPSVIYWTTQNESSLTALSHFFKQEKYKDYYPYNLSVFKDQNGDTKFALASQKLNEIALPNFTVQQEAHEFKKQIGAAKEKNLIPSSLSIYNDSGKILISGIWAENEISANWDITYDTLVSDLQKVINERAKNNFKPYIIKGYENKGQLNYLVAWQK